MKANRTLIIESNSVNSYYEHHKDCISYSYLRIDYTSCIPNHVVKSKGNNQDKDFTEINKLLANGYKHFQNEETDSAYYYFNKAKMPPK
jgi:hypothetical protein